MDSIGREQNLFVAAQASGERAAESRNRPYRLGGSQRPRMLLQPLDAEDLFAQDLIVAPVRARRQLLDDFAEKWVQESASLMSRASEHYANLATCRAMSS